MSKVHISLAFSRNHLTAPLLDGELQPEGVELTSSVVPVSDLFWRQLRYGEFDASEMSLSELCVLAAQGRDDWLGIPVFPSRAFFHTRMFVSAASGITGPAGLKGRRIGVPDYAQTAALWTRGALQHYYGVAPQDASWVLGRRPERSHATLTGARLPENLDHSYVAEGDDLGSMLREGRVDAVMAYGGAARTSLGLGMDPPKTLALGLALSTFVDPVRRDLDNDPAVRPLFPDQTAAGLAYHRDTGLLPINHVLVVKRGIAERYPWLPRALYDAFAQARDVAFGRLTRALEPYAAIGALDTGKVTAAHAAQAYGITANLPTLTAATRYAYEQGLIGSEVGPAALFAPTTRHL